MVDNAIQSCETTECTPTKTERRITWTPAVDVIENENEVLLIADMPGATAENVNIAFENGKLSIEARVDKRRETEPKFMLREHGAGTYARSFTVGDRVDAQAISAEIKHGQLTLRLPKAEAAKARRIEVKGL